jgi:hypothetical protein
MKNEEISKLDFSGWPLPDKVLVEIGRVSSLWTSLENTMTICISKLSGFDVTVDPKPLMLLLHTSFPQKIDTFGSLCEYLVQDFPNLKKYKDVISKIKCAQKLRNEFLHNGMSYDIKNDKITVAKGTARGKLETELKFIELSEIKKASIEINEAQTSLYNLLFNQKIEPYYLRLIKKK